MFGVSIDTAPKCHELFPPLESLRSLLKFKCVGLLLLVHWYQLINLVIYAYQRLIALVHFKTKFLLSNPLGLSIGFSSTVFGWKLLNRRMVVFLYLLYELLFAFLWLFLDFLALLLPSGLLSFYLGCNFIHHLLIPLYFLIRIFSPILDKLGILNEVFVFLKQDVHFGGG